MKLCKNQILHQHFESCASTQVYLNTQLEALLRECQEIKEERRDTAEERKASSKVGKEIKKDEEKILISTHEQTQGIGQRSTDWLQVSNSLAFSFTFKALENSSLSSFFVGLTLCDFIKEMYKKDLFLKWPNDVLTSERKKCAGILLHHKASLKLGLCGIGMNLGPHKNHHFGFIDENQILKDDDFKDIPFHFYDYFLKRRETLNEESIIQAFEKKCIHLNEEVFLKNKSKRGIFLGIDLSGRGIIESQDETFFLSSESIVLNKHSKNN